MKLHDDLDHYTHCSFGDKVLVYDAFSVFVDGYSNFSLESSYYEWWCIGPHIKENPNNLKEFDLDWEFGDHVGRV